MQLKRYRMELSFTLPLPDKRYTHGLLREAEKRLRPVLGMDIQIRSEVSLVKKNRMTTEEKLARANKKVKAK